MALRKRQGPAIISGGRVEPRLVASRAAPLREAATLIPASGARAKRAYAAAASSRLTSGMTTVNRSANEELRTSIYAMRARARQFERDHPFGARFFNLVERNVIGPQGIQIEPRVMRPRGQLDEQASRMLLAEWERWSQVGICTMDGRLSGRLASTLIARSWVRDGEILVRMITGRAAGNDYNFSLQLIEADALDETLNRDLGGGRAIIMGVEVDPYFRATAYHLRRRGRASSIGGVLGGTVDTYGGYDRVPAEEILHIFPATRAGQVRGASALHPVMQRVHMMAGYYEAELVASRMASLKNTYITSPDGDATPLADEQTGGASPGDVRELVENLEPGETPVLPASYDVKSIDPQHPTSAFDAFTRAMLIEMSAGTDTSYAAFTGDLRQVSYSGLRQGHLDDRDRWRMLQGFQIERAEAPIYRQWVRWGLLGERFRGLSLQRPGDLERYQLAAYRARGWSWVDPQREVNAVTKAIDYRLVTRHDVVAQTYGRDWGRVAEEIGREAEIAAEAELSLPEDEANGVRPDDQDAIEQAVEQAVEQQGEETAGE